MKIAIIGSTQYKENMIDHMRMLESHGHDVFIPALDDHEDLDDLGVCEYNRWIIEQAEEVHMLWDQRSVGAVFDFGMVFALRKPFKIIYLEPKTLRGVMEKYEKACRS